jgi:hypothetical protein
MVLTSAGSVFADKPQGELPAAPVGDEQFTCWPWWVDPWLSDVNWNGVPEIRHPPIPYGGFTSPDAWIPELDGKLGDIAIMFFPVFNPSGFPATFWPVDVYLWRPPTIMWCEHDTDPLLDDWYKYWPLQANTQMPDNLVGMLGGGPWSTGGTWYLGEWDNPDGPRRQSWPTYQETDVWGFYYAKFMLPRDEVWYPCGYPCKWGCSWYDPWADAWEFHSPWLLNTKYPPAVPFTPAWYAPIYSPLYWPYKWDWFYGWVGDLGWTAENEAFPGPQWVTIGAVDYYLVLPSVSDPQDTVGPLTMWAVEAEFGTFIDLVGGLTPWAEIEVLGYDWKTSDLKWAHWPDDWPWLCEDHDWYP